MKKLIMEKMHNSSLEIDVQDTQPVAAPRLESQIAGLIAQIDSIQQLLHQESSAIEPACLEALAEQLVICSSQLGELESIATESRQYVSKMETLNHELRLQLMARSSESQTDSLTGLANRRAFDREFSERCVAAQQTSCPLMLALFDIDHFKTINDSFGHHVGDAVLRGLGELIRQQLLPETFVARYGGEEFALVISGTSIDEAIDLVEQIRRIVCETRFSFEGQCLSFSMSCGLAMLARQDHCEHLLQRADAALYAAKQAGRNRTFWYAGRHLHLATTEDIQFDSKSTSAPRPVVDLSTREKVAAVLQEIQTPQTTLPLALRTNRANWCDGAVLFWSIRQRLAEWKEGGEPFCVLAIEIDDASRIGQMYGSVALHFMMRAQVLHLDSVLRNMDIVARTGQSRLVVLLPRSTLASLSPLLNRFSESMNRFVFPTANKLVEYSISIGVGGASKDDDPDQLVSRAEAALMVAQRYGKGQFYASDSQRVWCLKDAVG